MQIPLILQRLDNILKTASESREQALALFGTAESLLGFLETVVKVNGVRNTVGINERIRDFHYAMCIMAGLDELQDPKFDYLHFAHSAISELFGSTLLGERDGLLFDS